MIISAPTLPQRVTVALIYGGRSSEHEISCVTAGSVLREIDPDRFDVVPIGISADGCMTLQDGDPDRLVMHPDRMPRVSEDGPEVLLPASTADPTIRVVENGRVRDLARVDVVFPLLHGPFGEDGTIQGALELTGVPYVGSGVLASAAGMDKEYTKLILRAAGLDVGEFRVVHRRDMPGALAEVRGWVASAGMPVFVKPARAGSSVGVTKVTELDGLAAALETAFAEDDKALVEVGVAGREVECGVLEGPDGAPLVADPVGEIVMQGDRFYDYEAKYLDDSLARLVCPTALTEAEAEALHAAARTAFAALGCRGLARVDMFLTEHGPVVNEVNTMPGFTPISMFPTIWGAAGVSYRELITHLVGLALQRA